MALTQREADIQVRVHSHQELKGDLLKRYSMPHTTYLK